MSVIYDLEHITTYRYRKPVIFGEHRAIFLPSIGFVGRILNHSLETNIPAKVRWMMDTLSKSVGLILCRMSKAFGMAPRKRSVTQADQGIDA